ncbi:MAG: hypothetical protein EA349_11635 [Halomonadaceae bacterium]|nr:MAG: hypothetical protein EA349_11635 [Halomonadaceae bacterium]
MQQELGMESLTPDRDELADRQAGQEGSPGKKPRKAPRPEKPGKGGGSGGNGGNGPAPPPAGGSNRRVGVLLLLLVITVAATGGWNLWEQRQQIQAINMDLQEAQNWISESRLHSARLEGDLAQADQQLSETGSAMQEQLVFLDSEMRKLWAVHQTNRPAIAENTEALKALRADLGSATGTASEAQEQASQALAASETQSGKLGTLEQELNTLREGRESLAGELQALQQQMAEQKEALEQTLTRAGRDRDLALEELTARLDRLERDLDGGASEGELAALADRLDQLEPVVASVDSARGQLTRRFTDLGERVDRLAQQISANGQ